MYLCTLERYSTAHAASAGLPGGCAQQCHTELAGVKAARGHRRLAAWRRLGGWTMGNRKNHKSVSYICIYRSVYVSCQASDKKHVYVYIFNFCIYVCTYVCMYVCIYVCMYVCMYVYISRIVVFMRPFEPLAKSELTIVGFRFQCYRTPRYYPSMYTYVHVMCVRTGISTYTCARIRRCGVYVYTYIHTCT